MKDGNRDAPKRPPCPGRERTAVLQRRRRGPDAGPLDALADARRMSRRRPERRAIASKEELGRDKDGATLPILRRTLEQ